MVFTPTESPLQPSALQAQSSASFRHLSFVRDPVTGKDSAPAREVTAPSGEYWPPSLGDRGVHRASEQSPSSACSSLGALGHPGCPACVSPLSISGSAGPPVRTPVTGSGPVVVQHDLINNRHLLGPCCQ